MSVEIVCTAVVRGGYEEARECIEGTPEVANVKVRPGHTPEAISGMSNEDKVPGEGKITYDIRLYAVTHDAEYIKIIVNVEAQKSFYPGYDLVTRAIFYCARMLSAQLDTEFTAQNYDDIKKVYSIWIFLKKNMILRQLWKWKEECDKCVI